MDDASGAAELSAACSQTLSYRETLIENYLTLTSVERPPCFVSQATNTLSDRHDRWSGAGPASCFRYLLRNSRDLDIVNFDELHLKSYNCWSFLEL
jgi:hypothetical protein